LEGRGGLKRDREKKKHLRRENKQLKQHHDERYEVFVKLEKVMLVCSEGCNEVEECLVAAGCWVVRVESGQAAVSQAQREIFGAAVLVSTGKEMDLAETAFNLRDISDSMQIVIVADHRGIDDNAIASQIAEHFVRNTRVLTLEGLETLLESQKLGKRE
jgi:hypothetical protein